MVDLRMFSSNLFNSINNLSLGVCFILFQIMNHQFDACGFDRQVTEIYSLFAMASSKILN